MKDFFTKQEKIFILFLLGGILIGSGIKLYKVYYGSNKEISHNGEKLIIAEQQIAAKAQFIDSLLIKREENSAYLNTTTSVESKGRKKTTIKENLKKASIEINTAQLSDLVRLPQIGPVLAQRIIDYRNEKALFKSIDEICKVKGIGKKKFNSIKSYIFITSKQK